MSRALRIMLVANDGFSAGHVTRTIAIARALSRAAAKRQLELATVLVTTSEADALLANEPIAVVRLPGPVRARSAGVGDAERRRLVRAMIDAAVDGFGPDLIVVDTFPTGPHGELAGIGHRAKRALVRRAVPDDTADLLATGLGDYDLAIIADDAGATVSAAAIPQVHVPPITLGDTLLDRDAARIALGLPETGRAILVASGGGGDADAATQARALAASLARLEALTPDRATIVLAIGPLDHTIRLDRIAPVIDPLDRGSLALSSPDRPFDRSSLAIAGVLTIRTAPVQRYLRAFDGAFSAAGYNTAHELAAAGVPAALFALPRPFDDQTARAQRLAASGHARVLVGFEDELIAGALQWMREAPRPLLIADGAHRAAEALLDLVTGANR